MISVLITISSFVLIAAVVIHLVVHGIYYNWMGSRLGLIMNGSLLSYALTSLGLIIYLHNPSAGATILVVAAISFVTLLAWRVRVLKATIEEIRTNRRNKRI